MGCEHGSVTETAEQERKIRASHASRATQRSCMALPPTTNAASFANRPTLLAMTIVHIVLVKVRTSQARC